MFRKLLLLDLKRLELIKMFLYFMKIDEGEEARKGLERMQRKMHSAVDMAIVTILAHYDKEHRRVSRAGHLFTTAASTPRVGGFLPHSMQEERDREDLSGQPSTLPSAAAAVSSSQAALPMASGSMEAAAGAAPAGMSQTNVVWGPTMDSTMGSAMSAIEATPNSEVTPTAAEMSDVLEKFDEAVADVEKRKREEKQAREERERDAGEMRSGEIEEQSSPKAGAGSRAAALAPAGATTSPRKAAEKPAHPASVPPKGAGIVATKDVTLSIACDPNSQAAGTAPLGGTLAG